MFLGRELKWPLLSHSHSKHPLRSKRPSKKQWGVLRRVMGVLRRVLRGVLRRVRGSLEGGLGSDGFWEGYRVDEPKSGNFKKRLINKAKIFIKAGGQTQSTTLLISKYKVLFGHLFGNPFGN